MIQSDSQAHILLSPTSSTEARGQVSDICKCLNRPVEWMVRWDKGLEDSGSRLFTSKGEDIHDPLGKSPDHQTVMQFMAAKGHRHWCQWTVCISWFSATFLCWWAFPTSPEFNWKPKSFLFSPLCLPQGLVWNGTPGTSSPGRHPGGFLAQTSSTNYAWREVAKTDSFDHVKAGAASISCQCPASFFSPRFWTKIQDISTPIRCGIYLTVSDFEQLVFVQATSYSC